MSSEYAIEINGLGKCYEIYKNPSDRLKQMLMRGHKLFYDEFWAIKNVNLKIKKGETIGIIGRNGSGKSTLLQMICGTLNQTVGEIKLNGRVAALLELGAGFNPEFSGIENIYMAASLYGLSNDEIDKRFESIVAFAEIGDHIFQAVKTYSSGMYVRLAFAVIVHVDADVLVVDEALAVGDAVFTQKCMRFIRKFKEKGTLLFVSHDMGSVLNLCERALWLEKGQIVQLDEAKKVSEAYLQYTLQEVYGQSAQLENIEQNDRTLLDQKNQNTAFDYMTELKVQNNLDEANGWKTGVGEIVSVGLSTCGDEKGDVLVGGEMVKMHINAVAHTNMTRPILGFLVKDKLGQDLFGENTLSFTDLKPLPINAGEHFQCEFIFKLPMLPNGEYSIMASLAEGDLYNHVQHHWLHNAIVLNVISSKVRYGLVGVEFKRINLFKCSQ